MRRNLAALASIVLLAACSRAEEPSEPGRPMPHASVRVVDGVTYAAETAILETFPVQLRTRVTLTNRGTARQQVELPGGCTVLLRAYRSADRSGSPAWDQSRQAVCTMQLLLLDLEPGESAEFQGRADAREILGDSLPAGRYYLTAVLRPNGKEVELAAGEAELAQ